MKSKCRFDYAVITLLLAFVFGACNSKKTSDNESDETSEPKQERTELILQVDIPELLIQSHGGYINDQFIASLDAANEEDFINSFVSEYRKAVPTADFSVVFPLLIEIGSSDEQVVADLKTLVNDYAKGYVGNVVRERAKSFGAKSIELDLVQGKDGQIKLSFNKLVNLPRLRKLLTTKSDLRFYNTYNSSDIHDALIWTIQRLRSEGLDVTPLETLLSNGLYGSVIGNVNDSTTLAAVDGLLNSQTAKSNLPSDLRFLWGAKYERGLIPLYAIKTDNGHPALDGFIIKDAHSLLREETGQYSVSLEMNAEGAREWERITEEASKRQEAIAIVIDDKVFSAPVVTACIKVGKCEISGNFTAEEAEDFSNTLKSGSLLVPVSIVSENTIQP